MRTVLVLTLFAMLPACSTDASGQTCGGFIANAATCPAGYSCVPAYDGEVPDKPGVCQKND
jgi:hypothetical protein